MLKSEQDVIELIEEDEEMMEILRAAKAQDLPDWWICAGFVRAKIWDTLHQFEKRTKTPDVDVIYFDPVHVDEKTEKDLEEKLNRMLPGVPWSVKNEARMHMVNDIEPYESSVDAISKFPETATALGVKLDDEENVVLTAPCGLEDVLNLEVKPTPFFSRTEAGAAIYEERIDKKDWKSIWPQITVYHI
ncbi:nucleotidyltransferase family protein [Alteribacter keqinensis]|uniref:Nucleotidyltransferase family protein n=1 Tax=Alteribacter keqinensis TaxID=2483800 RepID=A0A3M7TPC9_9BACI|nr:nucleotidyltransferase family protein [Alteribacter keqinensis]RNA66877.1 nucleotidyltransferase family protein [Alteribacter keqinensis]